LVARRSVEVIGSDAAVEYLVEFEDDLAVREVGLDEHGQPVVMKSFPDYGVFAGECELEAIPNAEVVDAEVFKTDWRRAEDHLRRDPSNRGFELNRSPSETESGRLSNELGRENDASPVSRSGLARLVVSFSVLYVLLSFATGWAAAHDHFLLPFVFGIPAALAGAFAVLTLMLLVAPGAERRWREAGGAPMSILSLALLLAIVGVPLLAWFLAGRG
jgi:hypothetical protein